MLAKQRLYMRILTVAIVVISVILLMSSAVLAQVESESAGEATANTLEVSPIRTDVSADPGEDKTIQIVVTNPSDNDVSVRPIQNDFIASGEDGVPGIILEETEFAEKHSLKRFMKPLESFVIPADSSYVVDLELVIPQNAEAGGYFGALRFAPTLPDTGGQVNMSASVTSIILLRVNGDVAEKLNITDFVVQQNDRPGQFFTRSDGIEAMVRFQNISPVQLAPFGRISVKKGNNVVYEADFNSQAQKDNVLPDSARRWKVPLSGLSGFGRYTVSATFTYGATSQSIDATNSFWIVPIGVIISAIVGLLIIAGVVVGVILRTRSKKRNLSL